MNIPYVKHFDENGKLTNPIPENGYKSPSNNRRSRREHLSKQPFYGCGKNYPITVIQTGKYVRVRQIEKNEDGSRKTIEHYILQ